MVVFGTSARVEYWRAAIMALLLVLLPMSLNSAGLVSSEYKLKAALIYKLTRFVEWPASSGGGDNFGICLLGRDDFGRALDALETRKVDDKPIRIQRLVQSEAVDRSCQILFISESKRPFLRSILHSLAHLPILTIGDVERFAEKGGMIEFTRGRKRIGFRINLQQANRAGLKIAAPLLELATIVETETP
jgi:hypothetical protein